LLIRIGAKTCKTPPKGKFPNLEEPMEALENGKERHTPKE